MTRKAPNSIRKSIDSKGNPVTIRTDLDHWARPNEAGKCQDCGRLIVIINTGVYRHLANSAVEEPDGAPDEAWEVTDAEHVLRHAPDWYRNARLGDDTHV